jgi:molybdenum cofactor biosynthesis enzyme MoaA
MRLQTPGGTININSHGGNHKQLQKIFKAGLDAIRVTIFSLVEENYNLYHRPQNYKLGQVFNSIKAALDQNIQVSLNLLVLPGFTDQPQEVEALLGFLEENPVDMIQMRNLNIDPDVIDQHMGFKSAGIGITSMIATLQREAPAVRLGSYTHEVDKY